MRHDLTSWPGAEVFLAPRGGSGSGGTLPRPGRLLRPPDAAVAAGPSPEPKLGRNPPRPAPRVEPPQADRPRRGRTPDEEGFGRTNRRAPKGNGKGERERRSRQTGQIAAAPVVNA